MEAACSGHVESGSVNDDCSDAWASQHEVGSPDSFDERCGLNPEVFGEFINRGAAGLDAAIAKPHNAPPGVVRVERQTREMRDNRYRRIPSLRTFAEPLVQGSQR